MTVTEWVAIIGAAGSAIAAVLAAWHGGKARTAATDAANMAADARATVAKRSTEGTGK